MDLPVTTPTERNEVFFRIVAQLASRRNVVDLQPDLRTARLTAPAVSLQD